LQRIRRNDYWDTFSLYLENTEDPAMKDTNLARKLADNRTEGEKRLAAVFQKYTKKQLEMKNQNNEGTSEEEEDEDEEEEEEESIIDDEDKNGDNLSITSETSDNEGNTDKTIKESSLFIEKNKPDISIINVYHAMDKTVSNKVDTLPEKCNEMVKTKIEKKNNTAVLKNENETISEKMVHKPCSSNTTLRNVVKNVVDTKTEEDLLLAASTANCTSSIYINKIEDI